MQLSALYRRGFVVPLNEEAERAIIINDVDENTAVAFFEIPNEEVFDGLWRDGLFNRINKGTKSYVDDYEETTMEYSKLHKLRDVLGKFKNEVKLDTEELTVVDALDRLIDVALQRKSPIFFIL